MSFKILSTGLRQTIFLKLKLILENFYENQLTRVEKFSKRILIVYEQKNMHLETHFGKITTIV